MKLGMGILESADGWLLVWYTKSLWQVDVHNIMLCPLNYLKNISCETTWPDLKKLYNVEWGGFYSATSGEHFSAIMGLLLLLVCVGGGGILIKISNSSVFLCFDTFLIICFRYILVMFTCPHIHVLFLLELSVCPSKVYITTSLVQGHTIRLQRTYDYIVCS